MSSDWTVINVSSVHNHDLLSVDEAKFAYRIVPLEVKEQAIDLANKGIEFSSIIRFLNSGPLKGTFVNRDISQCIDVQFRELRKALQSAEFYNEAIEMVKLDPNFDFFH